MVPLLQRKEEFSLALSHVNLYNMNVKNWTCQEMKCQWKINLVQHMIKSLYLNIQCSHIGGEICGSFGFSFPNNDIEICFDNHTYSFEIQDDIIIWAYNTSKIEFDCSFWTSDKPGDALEKHNFEEIPLDESLLQKSVIEIMFNQTVPISPVEVYELSYNDNSVSCPSNICKAEIDFTWLWEKGNRSEFSYF